MPTYVLFLSLGLDTLAVALSLGIAGLPRARWVRVGLSFALFEGLMPVVGLLIGRHLSGILGEVAAYAAAGLLIVLGGYEIREALADDDTEQAGTGASPAAMPAVGLRSTLFRGLSVSLDELAVGFSLGVLHVPLAPALGYVAVQAFVLTFVGLWLGGRVGARLGERAELAAGVLLVLLGIAMIVSEATGAHWL